MGPDPAGLIQLEILFKQIINIFVGLSFIALVIMLFWAGVRFLTSGGEPNAVKAASQTVTWALLGMLFLVIAWLILQLIKTFTGIDITFFDVTRLCVVGILGCP